MLQGQTTDLRFALNETKQMKKKKTHSLSLNIVLELEISFHIQFPINNMHTCIRSSRLSVAISHAKPIFAEQS